ncbi:hypothetical protein T11_2124 [Trichinella zimbabwensis]|uniref:Uncharacterized protein n=1 Tax=Trichinella zimbabwensis TaxID=268475 RepID=A0A0V1GQF2_9BILA|nr:hypothetical protein T11_10326 [Trichinella zimbabwensis]KRZ00571.1 hypothetical protein T11_2124 [Trichinella zimbabwensis]
MLRTNNHQKFTATSGVEKCILSQISQRHWFQFTLSHDCFARYPCQGGIQNYLITRHEEKIFQHKFLIFQVLFQFKAIDEHLKVIIILNGQSVKQEANTVESR